MLSASDLKGYTEDGETFDDYARYCVVAAMGEIISMVHNSGADPSTINPNNMNDILLSVARLKLNANAVRESAISRFGM